MVVRACIVQLHHPAQEAAIDKAVRARREADRAEEEAAVRLRALREAPPPAPAYSPGVSALLLGMGMGADFQPGQTDMDGWTALHTAVQRSMHDDTMFDNIQELLRCMLPAEVRLETTGGPSTVTVTMYVIIDLATYCAAAHTKQAGPLDGPRSTWLPTAWTVPAVARRSARCS